MKDMEFEGVVVQKKMRSIKECVFRMIGIV